MADSNRGSRRTARGGSARREVPRDELIAENARLKERLNNFKRARRASNLAAFGRTVVRWSVGGFCTWAAIHELAGKDTHLWAKIDASISSESLVEVAKAFSPRLWILIISALGNISAGVGTYRYRKLNKRLIKKVGELTRELESGSDPDRTSSGLSEDGETHDRDKV